MTPEDGPKLKALMSKRLDFVRDICALIGLLTVVGWTLRAIGFHS